MCSSSPSSVRYANNFLGFRLFFGLGSLEAASLPPPSCSDHDLFTAEARREATFCARCFLYARNLSKSMPPPGRRQWRKEVGRADQEGGFAGPYILMDAGADENDARPNDAFDEEYSVHPSGPRCAPNSNSNKFGAQSSCSFSFGALSRLMAFRERERVCFSFSFPGTVRPVKAKNTSAKMRSRFRFRFRPTIRIGLKGSERPGNRGQFVGFQSNESATHAFNKATTRTRTLYSPIASCLRSLRQPHISHTFGVGQDVTARHPPLPLAAWRHRRWCRPWWRARSSPLRSKKNIAIYRGIILLSRISRFFLRPICKSANESNGK